MQKGGHYSPSLTDEEMEAIANAANNVKIPSVEVKELTKCNILENFLHSDAEKISSYDGKTLEDQFSFVRDASVIHGRYANGPINPRCPLTPYEMGVNEASAWLVRRSPALLTHQRLLSDLSRQVVKNSGLNLKQFKSSSQQSNQYFQTPERRTTSTSRSGIHYRLQGQYRGSLSSIMDGDAIGDDMALLNRGLGSNVISHFTESQFVELSRNDVTMLSSINDGEARIEMQVDEVDKCLDESEILQYANCTRLEDVRTLKIPCNDYTVLDSRALAKCVRLKELDLSENSFTEFARDLNLPKLKYLEITGNRFLHQPLVEQFPNLVVLNFDDKFKQNMNYQAVAYFCPKLKFINGEYFEEPISDYFHNYIMDAKMALDLIIRNKWESEFADRCPNILNNQERMSLIDELVQQLKERNLLIDDNLTKYKDLLIFKLTEEYLKSKLNDTEDELLAGGVGSVKRSTSLYCNIEEEDDDDDEKLLERFIDVNQSEMTMLQELTDELIGNNVQNIVSQVMLTTTGPNGQPQQYIVQQPQSVFHIGQSLRQNKSVVMTVVKPLAVKGRPVAEFLPGELRNKDYVKGYMASEIYKKAVKDTLGQKGTPKKHKVKKPEVDKNWSGAFNGPLNEIGNSGDPNNKKRGRPPKGLPGIPGSQNYQDSVTEVVERSGTVPARPKKRRTLGPYRSLRDIYKTDGNENDVIDYDPLHFIRCHAKDNAPLDQDTKVWRCVFEPNPNQPNQTTHIVATCGGECVCLIDCKAGKVLKRFKREDEEFMCLAWTTLEIEPGKRLNILAAAGKLKEIRLLFPDFLHYCDMRGHQEDISALVFHPSMPQILFSGDTKASIFIWDIGTPTANQSRLMRYQLLMRLRCPRLDVNPVLNLVFLDHYSFLVAGCEDGMFAWKITEYRSEKREREPDMELKLFVDDKIDVPLDSISYDGLAQLSRTALVFKIVHNSNLLVFDFGTTLERRKGLQKVVPIDICGTLNWQKTEDFYINVTARQNLGAVLCGDSIGNIWIYDLDRFIEECPERVARDFVCVPYKVLEWPECNVTGNERQISEGGSSGGGGGGGGGGVGGVGVSALTNSPELKSPVINTVDLSSDGLYIIAVTDNNLVCIWQLSKPNMK